VTPYFNVGKCKTKSVSYGRRIDILNIQYHRLPADWKGWNIKKVEKIKNFGDVFDYRL